MESYGIQESGKGNNSKAKLMKKIFSYLKTKYNIIKNKRKKERFLEIGPGANRINDFETLNITDGQDVDYILDLSKKLPFEDNSFDLIYASHVVEHIPWFFCDEIFKEFLRILKSGGVLEVWVPDGLKICKALIDFEEKNINCIGKDGWYRFNDEKNPYRWINGRIFAYGDGTPNPSSSNWHRSIFTEKSLKNVFIDNRFKNVSTMETDQVRGYDHGWINLGIKGMKP